MLFNMAEGRLKAPLDANGLPIIPQGFWECYEECPNGDPGKNRHHILYPRNKYRQAIERQARECGAAVVKSCRCKHASYHATYLPPPIPDRFTMIDLAAGDITPTVSEVFIRGPRPC